MTVSRFLAAALGLVCSQPLWANPYADNLSVRLLPGWQQRDGSHLAGLELTLAPGWKTYWRAPGDAGVPPVFSWGGSDNVARVDVIWPRPEVFYQNGLRSIGYEDQVILPLRITPNGDGAVQLNGSVQLGICEEVCVPIEVDLTDLTLPATTRPVAEIAAALADRPTQARDAGVGAVTCSLSNDASRTLITASIELRPMGGDEVVVLEAPDNTIWVSEAISERRGGHLFATSEVMSMSDGPLVLDRSAMRITVLAGGQAVDIRGCRGG